MTLTKRFTILGAALAMLLAAFVLVMQPAEAGNLRESVSGNFIDTAIDTNGDGLQANAWSGQANGSGSPSYEGLVEIAFGATGLCDPGEVEGVLVAYSIVRRYDNGDLLFSESDDGTLCFNPGSGLATLSVNAEITGGTGRHDGASGSYTADYTVEGLVQDATQAIVHGAFYGETTGS